MRKKLSCITIATILTVLTACGNDSSDSLYPSESTKAEVTEQIKQTEVPGKTARDLVESGNNYMQQKEYDKAVENYKAAISKDSKYMDAYTGIIEAYIRLKDPANKSTYCKKAFENLSEDQVKAINHKFRKRNLQALDAIHSSIMTAIFENPNDSEVNSWLGYITSFGYVTKEDGNISSACLENLKCEDGEQAVSRIILIGKDTIDVKVEFPGDSYYPCRVYVEGYESDPYLCVE